MTKTTPDYTETMTPGEELWNDYLDPLNLTVGKAASAIGVSRKTMSAIINGSARITPEMSVRLSKALGTDLGYWAMRQITFDLSQIDPKAIKVRRLTPRGFRE